MKSGYYLDCFKAYDVRGMVPSELNPALVEVIGRSYAKLIHPKRVAVGHDIRLTSPELAEALCRGLVDSGVEVVDIGLVGTEEVYFAVFSLGLDGGVMITASHNPRDYNGLKFTRDKARPISADTGLQQIEETAMEILRFEGNVHTGGRLGSVVPGGSVTRADTRPSYIEHLLGYIDVAKLRPLKVVVNAGNGGAGLVIDLLERSLPFEFVKINYEPNGLFPNGVPNPMLLENRAMTSRAVLDNGADLGIAWDGDFDRCFFFDERGDFVEGYYLVGLLAERALKRHPGGRIINDPRLVWNTEEMVRVAGGIPVMSRSGHAFIKEKMREVDAVYGGEMSAHHYFKEFSYCDSGMIPWLQVTEAICEQGRTLSAMVDERIARYPVSGEINLTLSDPAGALAAVAERYRPEALSVDELDGLSIEFPAWRFNVRMSNTEPVVRVNVESRGDKGLLDSKTQEVLETLEGAGAGSVS
jgi:phosphomannomutase